jgi:hypothetical protein
MLPAAIDGFIGVTEIEARTAEVTVSVVMPLTDPSVAVIVAAPVITPEAKPPELIVATGDDEFHVTKEVKSCVLLSLYVPVAWNCTVSPAATVPLAGLTAMDTNAGAPTVTAAEPHTTPAQALRFAMPCAMP